VKGTMKLYITAAVFAAMTCVLTFTVKIPAPVGYTHPGDCIIYLAACILPFPYAPAAAAVGGALADLLSGYPQYIIPTLFIKSLMTMLFTRKSEKILIKRNVLMTIPAGLMLIAGYFVASCIMYDFFCAVGGIWGDIIQATMSAAVFVTIAAGLDKIKFKQKLGLLR